MCDCFYLTCFLYFFVSYRLGIRVNSLHHYHDSHYYYHKDVVWFLNASLFETFMELKNLNLSLNWIGGWVENEGKLFVPSIYLFLIIFSNY